MDERDIYQQQYAHFGRMNDILYKMPPIFATILGGLWYFAVSFYEKDRVIAAAVFVFSAVASACFMIALIRFRLAFNAYIDNINKLDGPLKVSIQSKWPSTINAMIFLLLAGFVISLLGSIYPFLN